MNKAPDNPWLTLLWLIGLVLLSVMWAGTAAAQDTWTVLPMGSRAVEPGASESFRDILQSELSARTSASFVTPKGDMPCRDVPCATKAAQDVGAQVVVFGSLNGLGRKIVLTITTVDAVTGEVSGSQKLAIDRLEDLDIAATRIAEAITNGTSTDETAELGTVTAHEVKPDRRREGERGLGLRVGGITPLGSGYGGASSGVVMDFSYWFETQNFAIEPRIGFRFAANEDSGDYFEFPMDVGAYYILGKGDFAPFIGGGGGLRWITESRQETVEVGNVIKTTNTRVNEDSGYGFGVFARGGLLLLRTYTMRLALTVDYNISFLTLNGNSNPQSLTGGIGVYF